MRSNRVTFLGILVACFSVAPAVAHAQAKLGYQQAQLLKDAAYYVLQVEGNLEKFDEKSANWKVGDSTVQMQDVEGILGTRKQLDQYMTNAASRFKQLPAAHPDVAAEKAHFDEVARHVEKTFSHLNEIKAGLSGVVAQGSGEDFKADFKRLQEINRLYEDSQLLRREPDRDIETIKQIAAVRAEPKRFAEKYAALLNQSTPEAQNMKRGLANFDQVMTDFDRRAAEWKQQIPAEIDQKLNGVIDDARRAVENKTPAWFKPENGIANSLKQTQGYVDLLAAFDPNGPDAKRAQEKIASTRAEVATIAKTMEADILEANRVPEDRFTGPDKDELVAKMKEKWAKDGLKGDVLAAGMNSSGWQRETRWEWNGNAWRKVDYSRTQGFIVRKLDDTTAAVYHVNFSKDHLQEDRISLGLFDDMKEEPSIERKILIKNIQ
jgi:hypothetical protein